MHFLLFLLYLSSKHCKSGQISDMVHFLLTVTYEVPLELLQPLVLQYGCWITCEDNDRRKRFLTSLYELMAPLPTTNDEQNQDRPLLRADEKIVSTTVAAELYSNALEHFATHLELSVFLKSLPENDQNIPASLVLASMKQQRLPRVQK
jgi:hypothetical protein